MNKEDFDTIEAIRAMSEEDMDSMNITRGQRCLLWKWRESLQPKTEPRKDTDGAAAASDTVTDACDITTLLAGLNIGDKCSGKSCTGCASVNCSGKVPRPYDHVDMDYKRPSDIRSFAELMYGSLVVLENCQTEGSPPEKNYVYDTPCVFHGTKVGTEIYYRVHNRVRRSCPGKSSKAEGRVATGL
jgi:hypothetical protein